MTPEAIVESAARQGLSVIAITDHNSNVNVQRAIAHAQENYASQILVAAGRRSYHGPTGHLLALLCTRTHR